MTANGIWAFVYVKITVNALLFISNENRDYLDAIYGLIEYLSIYFQRCYMIRILIRAKIRLLVAVNYVIYSVVH